MSPSRTCGQHVVGQAVMASGERDVHGGAEFVPGPLSEDPLGIPRAGLGNRSVVRCLAELPVWT